MKSPDLFAILQSNIHSLVRTETFFSFIFSHGKTRTITNKNTDERKRYRLIFLSGKILQFYGDGTLITFYSAIEAVDCAVDIQRELQKEPGIPLRIGMHTGVIVYYDEGIYGDGVNIASRIEGLSTAESVLVLDKLVDEMKNHPRFQFNSLGFFDL